MKNAALITGASNGIGKELARIHAAKGGDVIAVATNAGRLQDLKEELERDHSVQVMTIVRDLTEDGAAQAVFNQITETGLEVEVLINNAGFGGQGRFVDRDWSADLAMIKLNIIALTELTRLFLPGFVARNRGRILMVSSTASLLPGPLQAVYFATKAFVTSFANALSGELKDTKVTVTNLMPGATDTGFAKTSGLDKTNLFEQSVSARSVAEAGYQGMYAGKMDVITGLSLSQRLMLRLMPFLPKRMVLDQVRSIQEVTA